MGQDISVELSFINSTTGPVPLVYVGSRSPVQLRTGGRLADIAPTLLDLMQLPKPAEMTGVSLLG